MRSFDLKLKGSKLPAVLARGLQSITVSDALDRLDTMEARFYVPTHEIEKNSAWHGETFKVTVKTDDGDREIAGDIIEVSFEKVDNQGVYLIVRGIDALHKLKRKSQSKTHEGKHSDVAQETAKAGGFSKTDVQGVSSTAYTYMQTNMTDAQFIRTLALANNYVVRVDDGKLRFLRKDAAGPSQAVDIAWKKISRFRVAHNLDGVVSKVTVVGYDPLKSDGVLKGQASASDALDISKGQTAPKIVQSKFGGVEKVVDNSNITTTSEAEALAKALLQRHADRFVRGSFETELSPSIQSGGLVNIEDAPKPVGGKFLVEEVVHSFDPGRGPRTRILFISDGLPK